MGRFPRHKQWKIRIILPYCHVIVDAFLTSPKNFKHFKCNFSENWSSLRLVSNSSANLGPWTVDSPLEGRGKNVESTSFQFHMKNRKPQQMLFVCLVLARRFLKTYCVQEHRQNVTQMQREPFKTCYQKKSLETSGHNEAQCRLQELLSLRKLNVTY